MCYNEANLFSAGSWLAPPRDLHVTHNTTNQPIKGICGESEEKQHRKVVINLEKYRGSEPTLSFCNLLMLLYFGSTYKSKEATPTSQKLAVTKNLSKTAVNTISNRKLV